MCEYRSSMGFAPVAQQRFMVASGTSFYSYTANLAEQFVARLRPDNSLVSLPEEHTQPVQMNQSGL
jgi:hypothetical protein